MPQFEYASAKPNVYDRPRCSKCTARMYPARIESGQPDFDLGTFACPACTHSESVVVKTRVGRLDWRPLNHTHRSTQRDREVALPVSAAEVDSISMEAASAAQRQDMFPQEFEHHPRTKGAQRLISQPPIVLRVPHAMYSNVG
jgi:hypothetical protein